MPLQNRATPFGEIVVSPARGSLMGNRGCLHDAHRTLSRRPWTTRTWISCLLSFSGRRRALMRPGYYTELFFLDEATALAAGHRPCAECRRAAFRQFVDAWTTGAGRAGERVRAADMDRAIHAERITRRRIEGARQDHLRRAARRPARWSHGDCRGCGLPQMERRGAAVVAGGLWPAR